MRKYFKRVTPSREFIRKLTGDGHFRHYFESTLLHPQLWHLSRHSTAGGVAVGLFCGLIPGPLQMPGAALAAYLFRVNLPLALALTLYTNPLTIIPLYVLAYTLGEWVIGKGSAHFIAPPDYDWKLPMESMSALGDWVVSLGPPLGIGLVLLATLLAASGYLLIYGAWTIHVALYRARRRRRSALKRGND